jgi:type II secretory pathway pseudopilin PulG
MSNMNIPPTVRSQTGSRPPAYTLLELLLVLVLIALVAAFAVPTLSGSLSTWQLRSAGDTVQTRWTQARTQAIRKGQTHVFRYQPQSDRFLIEPWMIGEPLPAVGLAAVEAGDDVIARAGRPDESERSLDPRVEPFRLSAGVVFAGMELADRDLLLAEAIQDGWSSPVLFHPDGTTSSAVLYLANGEGQALEISLRGLTGTCQVGEIRADDELGL